MVNESAIAGEDRSFGKWRSPEGGHQVRAPRLLTVCGHLPSSVTNLPNEVTNQILPVFVVTFMAQLVTRTDFLALPLIILTI